MKKILPIELRRAALAALALGLALTIPAAAQTAAEPDAEASEAAKAPEADTVVATSEADAAPAAGSAVLHGMRVVIDPETGELRAPTPGEAKAMSIRLKSAVNRSSKGLYSVTHVDGTQSLNLQGRFLNVSTATVGSDGKVERDCRPAEDAPPAVAPEKEADHVE